MSTKAERIWDAADNDDQESLITNLEGATTTDLSYMKFGVTALMKASVNGNMALVRALIGANADLNATEKEGYTALMLAAEHGNTDVVQALILAGANLDQQNNFGMTALMRAAYKDHVTTVQALLQGNAVRSIAVNRDGRTAADLTHSEEIRRLIKAHEEEWANDPVMPPAQQAPAAEAEEEWANDPVMPSG